MEHGQLRLRNQPNHKYLRKLSYHNTRLLLTESGGADLVGGVYGTTLTLLSTDTPIALQQSRVGNKPSRLISCTHTTDSHQQDPQFSVGCGILSQAAEFAPFRKFLILPWNFVEFYKS